MSHDLAKLFEPLPQNCLKWELYGSHRPYIGKISIGNIVVAQNWSPRRMEAMGDVLGGLQQELEKTGIYELEVDTTPGWLQLLKLNGEEEWVLSHAGFDWINFKLFTTTSHCSVFCGEVHCRTVQISTLHFALQCIKHITVQCNSVPFALLRFSIHLHRGQTNIRMLLCLHLPPWSKLHWMGELLFLSTEIGCHWSFLMYFSSKVVLAFGRKFLCQSHHCHDTPLLHSR